MSYINPLPQLPEIPQELVPNLQYLNQELGSTVYTSDPREMTRDGKKFLAGTHQRYRLGQESKNLLGWIRENIIQDYDRVDYTLTAAPCHGPHFDRTRDYVCIYVVKPGGSDVRTVCYDADHTHPCYNTPDRYVNDYDDLREIESYLMPTGVWYLLEGRTQMHSVEGITSDRITVQISINQRPNHWLA